MTGIFRHHLLYLTLGALVLMSAGFYNGYPLVYSDTHNYIASGMLWDTPITRPATYGIFIYLTSLGGVSLWSVIFVQSWLVSYLIYLCFACLTPVEHKGWATLATCIFLSVFTGVSWVSSELLADIFTPLTILSLAVLLIVPVLKKSQLAALYAIFFISNATHISHMLISAFLLLVTWLAWTVFSKRKAFKALPHRTLTLILLMGAGFITMTASIAKSKHIYLISHMHDIGILKPYLDEYCPEKDYILCKYKNDLPGDFIWDADSPVYKPDMGWKESREEYQEIVLGILTEPVYLGIFIRTSLVWTGRQLLSFKVGNGNIPYPKGSKIDEIVAKYFASESGQYRHSKQSRNTLLPVPVLDFLHYAVMLLSIVFLVIAFCWSNIKEHVPLQLRFFSTLLLLGILANAVICVSLVYVAARFGCRVMWLIPLIAILVFMNYYVDKPVIAKRSEA